MQLEPLGTFDLAYDADGLTLVRPFAGHEAQGYGTGTGTFTGERISGSIRWANYPRMRDDGVLMPDVRGVISTSAGPVLFEFHGYSVGTEHPTKRLVTSALVFRTDVEEHRWLNEAIAVHDGWIDFADMTTSFPTYLCVPAPVDETTS